MLYTRASCAAALEELELDGLDGHALDGLEGTSTEKPIPRRIN